MGGCGTLMEPIERSRTDTVVAVLTFLLTLVVFLKSPVEQVADSRYSLVLADSLIRRQSFDLTPYFRRPLDPATYPGIAAGGYPYQLSVHGDRVYYGYPVGGSILAIPFVLALETVGVSVFHADGRYHARGEDRVQVVTAGGLMAALAALTFLSARLLLPVGPALIVALGQAFGTQVWSTASRGLWSQTWQVFLQGIVVWLLLRAETGAGRCRPVLLATLLSWMYFARPTSSITVVGVTVYMALRQRSALGWYLATGGGWLALFLAYGWYHYPGQIIPLYYLPFRSHLSVQADVLAGLVGALVSPSRGLLICVPVTVFVAYLVIRHAARVRLAALAWLAGLIVLVHVVMLSFQNYWAAGASFGSRYLTDVLGWLTLLAILGVRALLDAGAEAQSRGTRRGPRAEVVVGAVLLVLSVVINGRGALSTEVWGWNRHLLPDMDQNHARVMDWRYPQWMAGLIHPPRDWAVPRYVLGTPLRLAEPGVEPYLAGGGGWSAPEVGFRRTVGQVAHIVLALDPPPAGVLELHVRPILPPGLGALRVTVTVNGAPVAQLALDHRSPRTYTFPLSDGLLRGETAVAFHVPDAPAAEPASAHADDGGPGVAVYTVRITGTASR